VPRYRDRCRTCTTVFLAAWLSGLSGGIAWAQDVDPRSSARLRLGPVYVAPTLEIRDIGVDTNVYNESLVEPIKDFVVTAIPTFVATVGSPRRGMTVRSATSFVYFAKQASERAVNEDLALTARGTFGRLMPLVEIGYLNTRERVSFEVDARARRVEERIVGGVQVTLTPKVSADVRGEFWQNAFDGDAVFDTFGLAAELNRESRTFNGSVNYRATPLTTVSLLAQTSGIRFKEASFRDTDSRQMLLGVDLNPRALISGSARVGYRNFRPLNPQLPEFSGLVGSAAVSYRLRSNTVLGFTFDRRTDFSYYIVEPYYVREGYGLTVRRQLTPQWDVELGATRTTHDYMQVLGTQGDRQQGHQESLVTGSATLGYDVGPRTRMIFGLLYQDRRSDISDRKYDGFRVGVSMIYGF
jgi:Putative beta-barrel porin 2